MGKDNTTSSSYWQRKWERWDGRTRLGICLGFLCACVGTWSSRPGTSFPMQWWKLCHDNSGLCLGSTPLSGELVQAHLRWTTETGLCIIILCSYWAGTRKPQTHRMTKMNGLFMETASSEIITPAAEGHFQIQWETFHSFNILCWMLFVKGFTSQFHFGICEHVRIKDKKVLMQNPHRLGTGDFAHISQADIMLNFSVSIILLTVLRLSWFFLCLNEWMFQCDF